MCGITGIIKLNNKLLNDNTSDIKENTKIPIHNVLENYELLGWPIKHAKRSRDEKLGNTLV